MFHYGQCMDNIKNIIRELNTMFSMLIELLTNDSLLQTATASVPSLISAIKATALTLCVMFTTMLYRGFNGFVNAISGTITQYSFISGDDMTKAQFFVSASDASLIVNDVDAGFLNFQPLLLNLQISIQGLIMKIIMII